MRRKRNYKRPVAPDAKYRSDVVTKFANHLMWDGKKSVARNVVYDALDIIKEREKDADPIAVFTTALLNVAPLVEVKSRRVGGANYQVPCEVRGNRRSYLAARWIISAARGRKGRPMSERLAEEVLLAFKKEGDAMKKRENVHKMAEANRAFAHYAW